MKFLLRFSVLTAAVVVAASALAQTQANFVASAQKALSVAPGFLYKADLNSLKKPIWRFEVAGNDGFAHRISVDAVTGNVLENRTKKLDKKAVRSGPSTIMDAGLNAVDAVAEEFRENTQIMRVEVRTTSKGQLRWKIKLKSLVKGDDKDDDDFDVTEDEHAEVEDIEED